MDFRQYDNAIGRFTVIDPLAEQDFGNSPYAFAGNNPALYGDPSGLKFMGPSDEGGLGMGNPFSSGGAGGMYLSGMSGLAIRDALEQEAWGPNFWMAGTKGGVGGNDAPTKEEIASIFASVGINVTTNSDGELGYWKKSLDVYGSGSGYFFNAGDNPMGFTNPDMTVKLVKTWVSVNSGEGSNEFNFAKAASITAIGIDNTVLAIDSGKIIGGASESLKVISKRTGIYGAILGGGIALEHMIHKGEINSSDMISLGLAAGALFLAVQPETIAIQAASIIVDGVIMAKDVYDISHPEN